MMPNHPIIARHSAPPAAAALAVLWLAAPAAAQTALAGYCSDCIDSHSLVETTSTAPPSFGWSINTPGGATGQLLIDVLVPTNENTPAAPPFVIGGTGIIPGSASQVSTTPFTSGTLGAYLGAIPTTPNPNPTTESFTATTFLNATKSVDAGATGFFVYQTQVFDFFSVSLSDVPHTSPLLSIVPGLPLGSFITAFFNQGPGAPTWVSAANNGGPIFVTSRVPEPSGLSLLGAALAGLGGLCWHRRRRASVACRWRQRETGDAGNAPGIGPDGTGVMV